jgi:DNA polymerase III epsilon subunit-like protein
MLSWKVRIAMTNAIIFDCEFLTAEGSPSRFWCGPYDPDPVVAQIGLVKLGLENDFPILDTLKVYVTPLDRNGNRYPLDPFFSQLTKITQADLDTDGVPLAEALAKVSNFASGLRLWSWGKDEFNMVAISCYVTGIKPPIPAINFANACNVLLKAGMPYDDIKRTRSSGLSAYFELDTPPLKSHDALDDALSLAHALQHVLRKQMLDASDLI